MKKIIIAWLAAAMLTIGLFSCQKQTDELVNDTESPVSAQQLKVFARDVIAYYQTNGVSVSANRGNENGATFIAPFFSFEIWGFVKFDPTIPDVLEIVFFSAELGPRDFYRENPDGTVSVHINCHNAEIYYYPNLLAENPIEMYGTGGRYNSNYTGPVIDFGNGFKIIDVDNLRNAAVTGNGKVSATGQAPWKTVLLRFIVNPGGVRETVFSVN
jgi:hypothetical protein